MSKKAVKLLLLLPTFSFFPLLSHADEGENPIRAISESTVVLTEDDGTNGEDGAGNSYGPGGGSDGRPADLIYKPEAGTTEEGVTNPGQNSPLRLSLLTQLNFGTIKMSGNTESYSVQLPKPDFVQGGLQERPSFVQVTDNRGNNAGWQLTAKISKPFTNNESVLTGSKVLINNAWVEPIKLDMVAFAPTAVKKTSITADADTLIATAAEGKGMGTWNILYGTLYAPEQEQKGNATTSVYVEIPGSVKKTVGSYQAEVEWTLGNIPMK